MASPIPVLALFIMISSTLYLAAAFTVDKVSEEDKNILKALHTKFSPANNNMGSPTQQYAVLYFGDTNTIDAVNIKDNNCKIKQKLFKKGNKNVKVKVQEKVVEYIQQPQYGLDPAQRNANCKYLAAIVGYGSRHTEMSILWSFYKDENHEDLKCPSPPDGAQGNLYMFTFNSPCTEDGGVFASDTLIINDYQKYTTYPTCSRIITVFAEKCKASFNKLIVGYFKECNNAIFCQCRINAADNAVLVYPGPWN